MSSGAAVALPPARTYPASCSQQSLWAPSGESAINVPAAVRFHGGLERGHLQGMLDTLTERHEALRTVLARAPDGSLEQRVRATAAGKPETAEHHGTVEDSLAGLLLAGSQRPFRLETGPLARAELHSFGPGDDLLIVWMHHAIGDLASSSVLAEEIGQLHAGVPLARAGSQMGDFAVRERAALADAEHRGYWSAVLSGADGQLGQPVPSGVQHRPARHALPVLPHQAVRSLQMLAASHRTTLAAVLSSAAIAVHAADAADAAGGRVVVGLTVSNRDLPGFSSTIGCLADQLPLAVDTRGVPTFGGLLARVREALLDAYDHRLPLGALLSCLRQQQPPVFAVNMNFMPPRRGSPWLARAAGARATAPAFPYGIAKARPDPWWLGDAVLAYRPRIDSRGLGGEIEGDAALHEPATLARYGRRFGSLLAQAARDQETRW